MTLPLREQVQQADRRRLDRDEVQLRVRIVDREGREFHAQLLNLSPGGFMAELDAELLERAPVRVELPTLGWLRATAVWSLGRRAGFAFRDAIAPHAYATLAGLLT